MTRITINLDGLCKPLLSKSTNGIYLNYSGIRDKINIKGTQVYIFSSPTFGGASTPHFSLCFRWSLKNDIAIKFTILLFLMHNKMRNFNRILFSFTKNKRSETSFILHFRTTILYSIIVCTFLSIPFYPFYTIV